MSTIITNSAEFTFRDSHPSRHGRRWLNYDKDGQAFLAEVYAANKASGRVLELRDYQIRCRCNPGVVILMTLRQNTDKSTSSAKYTLITVKGYAELHDNRCENHMANGQEDNTRENPPPKTPVRPGIYGINHTVALDSRGCTKFGSGGERIPSDHLGKKPGKRTATEPRPAKWGKAIIGAAHYNVTLWGIQHHSEPKLHSIFQEIAFKAPKWTFGPEEPLKSRMFIPYLNNGAREDVTPQLMSQLSRLQEGPGYEGLFVLGTFGQTHPGDPGLLEIRFPVKDAAGPRRSSNVKECPYVLLPMERELFTTAQGAVLKRDPHSLWHYAAAILGYKDGSPMITDLALLPYLNWSGAIVESYWEKTMAELLISHKIPFHRPIKRQAVMSRAWGDKPPEFVLLDQRGLDKAFIVHFGDKYFYDREEFERWDTFYRSRAQEWKLDYLPWETYKDDQIPKSIIDYLTAYDARFSKSPSKNPSIEK